MRFVSSHWGDLIGLLLLYTGVVLALVAATLLSGSQPITHLGESLVLAGMGLLKLRGPAFDSQGSNTNGKNQITQAPLASGQRRSRAPQNI